LVGNARSATAPRPIGAHHPAECGCQLIVAARENHSKAGHRRSTGGREWFVTNLDYLKAIGKALALKEAFTNDETEEIG
jgi:hypothetical protein